jgi:type IV secretory pathway VirB4 component
VFRVRGRDFECIDDAERRALTQRFEQALRQLPETYRLYQYLVKRPATPIVNAGHPHPVVDEALRRRATYLQSRANALFELDLYLVVLSEPDRRRIGAVSRPSPALSVHRVTADLAEQVKQAVGELHQKANAFAVQLRVPGRRIPRDAPSERGQKRRVSLRDWVVETPGIDGSRRCNQVQGATASTALTAGVAM